MNLYYTIKQCVVCVVTRTVLYKPMAISTCILASCIVSSLAYLWISGCKTLL